MISNKDKILSFIELMDNDELEEIILYIKSNFSLKKNPSTSITKQLKELPEEIPDEFDIMMIEQMKKYNDDLQYNENELKKILDL